MRRKAWCAAAVTLGLAVTGAADQQELPPHLLLLARIKHKMAQNLSRLHDYICLATIERARRESRQRHFAWTDTLRLEDKDLLEMVGSGMVANGDFALHANSIFGTNAPTFQYAGREDFNGHRAVRYHYRVSQLVSGYRLTIGASEAVVAYHGSFWADAESLDLLALDVHADEVPPELLVSQAITRIEYGKARIGSSDFLPPKIAELVLEDKGGSASRNRTQFTHCRQYTAESVLRFDPPAEPAPEKRVTEVALPAGLALEMRLESTVDSQKSALGDTLVAKLLHDVKQDGKVMAPAGALVKGRIRKLEKRAAPGLDQHYVVGPEFSEIELTDARLHFLGQLEQISGAGGVSRELPYSEFHTPPPQLSPALETTAAEAGHPLCYTPFPIRRLYDVQNHLSSARSAGAGHVRQRADEAQRHRAVRQTRPTARCPGWGPPQPFLHAQPK